MFGGLSRRWAIDITTESIFFLLQKVDRPLPWRRRDSPRRCTSRSRYPKCPRWPGGLKPPPGESPGGRLRRCPVGHASLRSPPSIRRRCRPKFWPASGLTRRRGRRASPPQRHPARRGPRRRPRRRRCPSIRSGSTPKRKRRWRTTCWSCPGKPQQKISFYKKVPHVRRFRSLPPVQGQTPPTGMRAQPPLTPPSPPDDQVDND